MSRRTVEQMLVIARGYRDPTAETVCLGQENEISGLPDATRWSRVSEGGLLNTSRRSLTYDAKHYVVFKNSKSSTRAEPRDAQLFRGSFPTR